MRSATAASGNPINSDNNTMAPISVVVPITLVGALQQAGG
jgi:hypothetical protein